ncbi:MAG: MBL fold metallo-hydrolase [Deltaproteobacteria bacterium]|jgi:phosphoribosyl 1,2-cyclic phosphodiesterase|nr:MBL fold metallo-hydrolase [Deltaproteobacteria bacterium]
MLIRFWGVRGSIPAPPSSYELRDKIFKALTMALETRLKPWDIPSFINMLPHEVKSFVGGNTPCIEISHGKRILIFDAGSGIRNLGQLFTPSPAKDLLDALENPGVEHRDRHGEADPPRPKLNLDLILTHTHWDHIQGLPFFAPIYNPDTILNIHGHDIQEKKRNLFIQQSDPSLFPLKFEDLPAKIIFHEFPDTGIVLEPFTVDSLALPHPGGSHAFRVKGFGFTVVFATDYEIAGDSADAIAKKEALKDFIANSDVFISDSQYSYTESHSKEGWGHSSALNIVELAVQAGVKSLYLFHHDPNYDDQKLYDILDKASSYARLLFPQSTLGIRLAAEDTVIDLSDDVDDFS